MTMSAPVNAASALFPDAPAGIVAPESARSLYRARTASWRDNHPVVYWGFLFGTVLGVLAAFIFDKGGWSAYVVAGVALATAIAWGAYHWSKAGDEFWQLYAKARGLLWTDGGYAGSDVPLLRRGDEQKVHHTLSGRIGEHSATIRAYTYTEITKDDDGADTRTDYDFTLVSFSLPADVASRFHGVYLSRKSFSFGKLQDALSRDRGVQLESVDFNKRYSLRVADNQDNIALYELFSTPFIEQLTHGEPVTWEQVGPTIVFYTKGHQRSSAKLDALCAACLPVLKRYHEEHS